MVEAVDSRAKVHCNKTNDIENREAMQATFELDYIEDFGRSSELFKDHNSRSAFYIDCVEI